MDVLGVLRGASTVGGAAFGGYAQDEKSRVSTALATRKAADEAERNRVLNTIGMAGINPKVQGEIAKERALGEEPVRTEAAIARERGIGPLRTAEAVKTHEGTAAIDQGTHAANATVDQGSHAVNRLFDNAHPAPVQPSYSFPTATGPDGKPVFAKGNNKTGELTLTDVAAKAGPGAKPSGEQEKSAMFYNMMTGAMPDIEKSIASGKIRGDAVSAALATPDVFSPITQRMLNPEEQTYLRGLRAFTAGQLRKETGAAFGPKELLDVHQRLFEGGGDSPELKVSKRAAREQALESMRQSALPALMYYESIKGQGEGKHSTAASAPAVGSREAAVAHLKAQGKSDAEILTTLGPP